MKLLKFLSFLFPHEKRELCSETAYARSVLNHNLTMEEMLEYYKEKVTQKIEWAIKDGSMQCVIAFPSWLIKDHKEKVAEYIAKEYKILYRDEHLMLVSWRKD